MARIRFYNKYLFFFALGVTFNGISQTGDSAPAKKHNFALYIGAGPNYYINNLVLSAKKVTELNYLFVGRLMWEPEHNLSIGIESGYNRLYSVDADLPPPHGSIHIVSAAIPVHIIVGMKFFKHFYGNFSIGQSILLNNVFTSDYGSVHSTSFSLGDFGIASGYKRSIHNRVYLGGEIKCFYFSRLNDKNIGLVLISGIRF